MALTLNGIAQGYVTDRVVEILRAGGIEQQPRRHGRAAGHGLPPLGRAVARRHRRSGSIRTGSAATLEVVDQAVATSGPMASASTRQAASTICSTRGRALGPPVSQRDRRDADRDRGRRPLDRLQPAARRAIARTLRRLGEGQVQPDYGIGRRPSRFRPETRESRPHRSHTRDGSLIDDPNGRRSPSCPQPARRPHALQS